MKIRPVLELKVLLHFGGHIVTFPRHPSLPGLTSRKVENLFSGHAYAFVSVSHLKAVILFGSNRGQKSMFRIWYRFVEKPRKLKVQHPSHAQSPSEKTLAEILVILYWELWI